MLRAACFVTVLCMLTLLVRPSQANAFLSDADLLQKSELNFTAVDRDKTFDTTIANLKTLFQRYKPATDSSSSIKSPLVVSGTEDRPRLQVSVEKCVFIICKTIDVDATVKADKRPGSCARDFTISADLVRSTSYLSDVYDRLDVNVCLQPVGANGTQMKMIVSAHHAPDYSTGAIQDTALDFLKLQAPPMLAAIRKTLVANGAVMK